MDFAVCFGVIFVWVMVLLITITITAIHLVYSYNASDQFSCPKTDRDAESFLQLMKAATLWNKIKLNFITRSSEGRNNFHNRLEVEHCWPDNMIGIPRTQQNAELAKQNRQQEQKYIDYNLRGVKPNYLQLKAQERLMEYPNTTWDDFSTQNIQEDVMLQISSNYLHDVEQLKTDLATLGQEIRNIRAELQKHRVNTMKGNSRSWALTQKEKQKRFCNYCHKKRHTPNWCRKKMRDEEIRRVQQDLSLKKNTAPTREYRTSDSNCRSQHDESVNRCPDSDDVNIPTNKLLTTKEEPCLDESNDLTTPDPEAVLRTRTRHA